jgi:hypothetical protein
LDWRLRLLLLIVVASWSASASPAMTSAIATILKAALAVSPVSSVASISTIAAILTVATIGTVAAVHSFAAVAERRLMRLNRRTAGCVHLIVVAGELGHPAIPHFVVAGSG